MDLCNNYSCVRAGWCKRITYPAPDNCKRYFYDCTPDNGFFAYRKNKAREIYERENKHDIFGDGQSEQEEYQNSYRQPGLWENDPADQGTDEGGEQGRILAQDSVLQLQCSSNRGSTGESITSTLATTVPNFEAFEQYLSSLVQRRLRAFSSLRGDIDDLDGETFIDHQIRRSEILQDPPRDGVSSTESVSGQPDD